jgi:hypothetical protein
VLDLAKSVPRLHGAVTAQRAIPTHFGFRVDSKTDLTEGLMEGTPMATRGGSKSFHVLTDILAGLAFLDPWLVPPLTCCKSAEPSH